ncbi:MAG: hypothetical protein HEQ39_06405 [Rhizobacter sp.]
MNPIALNSNLRTQAPLTLQRLPAHLTQGLDCWVVIPERLNRQLPPLVAVHGVGRDAKNQAALHMARATAQGRMVIAPLFDEKTWPGYQRIATQRRRPDLALLTLLETLSFVWGVNTRTVSLFGYSGGAQFAHRFAMLHPHRVDRLTACSAGWYTWPNGELFPCGLGGAPHRPLSRNLNVGDIAAANLDRFLQIPINVAVGELDNQVDPLTRDNDLLNHQQGTHRLERATRWSAALRECAAQRGLKASINLHVLPQAGHDFRQCMRSGLVSQLAMPCVQGPAAARPTTPQIHTTFSEHRAVCMA